MKISIYDDIFFIEGTPPKYEFIDGITTESQNFPNAKSLKTLDDVKDDMALFAKNLNGNAIIKFRYSEKKSFWKKIFGIGSSYIQASGIIVFITQEELDKL